MLKISFVAKRIVELTPLSITIIRETKRKIIFIRLFLEHILILPPLYIFLTGNILQFILMFIMSFVSLHSFYENFYIFNDTWVVNREDYPAPRTYIKIINIPFAIIIRVLYFLVTSFFLITIMGFSPLRVAIPTFILLLLLLIHNMQRKTLRRISTYVPLRALRLLYIPLLLLGYDQFKIKLMLIVLLPWLFIENLGYYSYLSNKSGKTIPSIDAPAYFWFGSFLPLQILLVWPYFTCLIGNLTIILLSLVKSLAEKSIRVKISI